MILPCEQRSIMRESDDGGQFQRCPVPKEVMLMGVTASGIPADNYPFTIS